MFDSSLAHFSQWALILSIALGLFTPHVTYPQQTVTTGETIVYISGGGSAGPQNIANRFEEIRQQFQAGPAGPLAEVQLFSPGETFNVPFSQETFIWYSQTQRTEIVNYLIANEGPGLNIMASSMGAGNFRNSILPNVLAQRPNFQMGTLVMIEAMAPLQTANYSVPSSFNFELYVSFETTYLGPAANTFRRRTGAGPLQPAGCQTGSNCFYLRNSEAPHIGSLLDYPRAMDVHGRAVGREETGGQSILGQHLRGQLSNDPPGAFAMLQNRLGSLAQNPIEIFFPDPQPSGSTSGSGSSGSSGGYIGSVGGGGGGFSGGGVGVESFPPWMSYKEYQMHRPKDVGIGPLPKPAAKETL